MRAKFASVLIIIFFVLSNFSLALAHSGRTDSGGCHYNHKTGDYHCHVKEDSGPIQTSASRMPSSILSPEKSLNQYCCKVCTRGKACGDTCISKSRACHVGAGCACDG